MWCPQKKDLKGNFVKIGGTPGAVMGDERRYFPLFLSIHLKVTNAFIGIYLQKIGKFIK